MFYFLLFLPFKLEMIQFDEHMFQLGWFNHYLFKSAGRPFVVGGVVGVGFFFDVPFHFGVDGLFD